MTMKHPSQRTVLKFGLDKCPFLLKGHKFGLDSVLSLELAFLIIFKTCLSNFNSLSIETSLFYQGHLSPKCAQIYVRPQKDDTYQYSISYSYFETMLSLIE